MELHSDANNEIGGSGIYINSDHQQKQLRDIIECHRILPNNCTFSQLDGTIQENIKTHCRNYKPICPSGNLNHNCRFRYIDNASVCRTLQPRYECKTCNRTFTLFGRSYLGVSSKRLLDESDDDHKCRSNRKKVKKTKELAAARYAATSGHAEEFIILQPQTQKTICNRCITGLASCCSNQNQSYASQSEWPLDVQRLPMQQHNILSSFSRSYSESFLPIFLPVSNENYDEHLLQQGMKESHVSCPSISTLLTQRRYKPFESVNEFGIPSLQEIYVTESGDDRGIAMSNVLVKQADNYDYSSHDASVFPTFLSTGGNYCEIPSASSSPSYLQTQFQGQGREEEEGLGGRYSIQMQCCDQFEIQPRNYSTSCQKGNTNYLLSLYAFFWFSSLLF